MFGYDVLIFFREIYKIYFIMNNYLWWKTLNFIND